MPKARNTNAKQQRESAKNRKAANKTDDSRGTQEHANGDGDQAVSQPFSEKELKVFDHFRRYLMTPGNMLCLSAQEIESMDSGLEALIDREMLVSEGSRGGYFLTPAGFDAMNAIER